MLLNHVVLALLWTLYGVLHSVLAGLRVKQFFAKHMGRHYKHYRLAYTVFAFVTFALIIWYQVSIESFNLFKPTLFSRLAGGLVAAAGLSLMLICIKKYFMGLSGLRSLLQEEVYTELLISGVHRYVRHPLYLGTFLFIWGSFLLFPTLSILITDVVITAYTMFGMQLEEKKLVRDFGEQYKRYQKSVPKLIPKFR
ncbi:MAG TPA: isoprenylcysteine carboxylmethyltransferase family protein [Flavisolibacter sp.]|jgi:protein-S-isoprenylcysteine O-methyltransferase Ste14|nr:isoprenylcysteine carboxylmethyltransferase family protein [Flavisolibacter sp.]